MRESPLKWLQMIRRWGLLGIKTLHSFFLGYLHNTPSLSHYLHHHLKTSTFVISILTTHEPLFNIIDVPHQKLNLCI
jgi:hypothetical protein